MTSGGALRNVCRCTLEDGRSEVFPVEEVAERSEVESDFVVNCCDLCDPLKKVGREEAFGLEKNNRALIVC